MRKIDSVKMKASILVSLLVFGTGTLSIKTTNNRIKPRIHDGQEVGDISEIPHHLTIGVYPTTENETFCEGALLSTNFVLTAAVCFNKVSVPNYVVVIYFGATVLKDATIARIARKVEIHPEWNNKTLENNLAILECSSVPLSDQLQPIRLPSRKQEKESFASWKATFSGRGRSTNCEGDKQILRVAETKVIGNYYCKWKYYFSAIITENNICTWLRSEGICKGDEGGSLFITEDDNKKTLIGIASFKGSECEKSQASVFTRVTSHLAWINAVTSIPIQD